MSFGAAAVTTNFSSGSLSEVVVVAVVMVAFAGVTMVAVRAVNWFVEGFVYKRLFLQAMAAVLMVASAASLLMRCWLWWR